MAPRERKRRQYETGSVYQACSVAAGCPERVDGIRPKHRCKGRWMGTFEAGFTKAGKRRRKTVTGKTEAEVKDRLKLAMREVGADGSDTKRMTVKAWSEKWLVEAEKANRPNTHTADIAGTRWIVEAIGHRQLDSLTPDHILEVHAAIDAAGRSSSTTARYHGTLMRMLKHAALRGHRINPSAFLVATPEPDVTDRDAIPTLEALAILKVATTLPHASRWVAALLQGMRQGECLGLTWDEVTEDKFTLAWQLQPLPYRVTRDRTSGFRVPRGYEARQLEGQMHLVRPKSAAGWRQVPMLPVMWQALQAWREASPENAHGLVWPALDGSPADEHQDRQEWFGIQGAAEVGHKAGRYYTVHEGRHTTGTLLRLLGVPDDIRFAIMGWSSVASSKTYEHIDAQRMKEMREALQGVAGVLELG